MYRRAGRKPDFFAVVVLVAMVGFGLTLAAQLVSSQVEQVVMNLAINAMDAMPDGGRIELITRRHEVTAADLVGRPSLDPGCYVSLLVRDTGHGMDPDTKERVLEPFFTTKGSEKRSGLGLSVTHGIVVGYGGDLVVDSEPGKGTAVHVYLPLAAQA